MGKDASVLSLSFVPLDRKGHVEKMKGKPRKKSMTTKDFYIREVWLRRNSKEESSYGRTSSVYDTGDPRTKRLKTRRKDVMMHERKQRDKRKVHETATKESPHQTRNKRISNKRPVFSVTFLVRIQRRDDTKMGYCVVQRNGAYAKPMMVRGVHTHHGDCLRRRSRGRAEILLDRMLLIRKTEEKNEKSSTDR